MESYLNSGFFNRLETLILQMQPNLRGFFGGKHLVNSYGQTVDFADYREYVLGDDIRRIDWNLYSRFKKYYLKLFTDERQMHVQIFLDCSASMDISPEKSNYAVGLAAALGYLAVHNNDKVSFHFIKGEKAENPFGMIVGRRSFFSAMGKIQKQKYQDEANFYSAFKSTPITANDGLTVLISDFFTENEWKSAVNYLCQKKRQVLLIHLLTPAEADPNFLGRTNLLDSEFVDAADGKNMKIRITKSLLAAYKEVIEDMRSDLSSFSKTHGVQCISITTDRPIEKVIFEDLLRVGVVK